MIKIFLVLLLSIFGASAIGLYVYPEHPSVVWIMLLLCWFCYRLHLRAHALFDTAKKTIDFPSEASIKKDDRLKL